MERVKLTIETIHWILWCVIFTAKKQETCFSRWMGDSFKSSSFVVPISHQCHKVLKSVLLYHYLSFYPSNSRD